MKRAKQNFLPLKEQQETEFEWDDDWYDIRPGAGNTIPRTSIEQLCAQSRKFWEEQEWIRGEWNKLSPLEKARQRTEAARNRLEGKPTSHLFPMALQPDKGTYIVMRFKVITCIDGRYSGELTV